MTTQLMVQPSSFMPSGVAMSQLGDVYICQWLGYNVDYKLDY
jgi:hypothetical protein